MTERDIFSAAIQISDPVARTNFVAAQCAGNDALRKVIERLLAHHEQAGNFLERPIGDLGSAWPADSFRDVSPSASRPLPAPGGDGDADQSPRPGRLVGAYKLLQVLGEGGMGQVWMAEQQQPVRRLVALKLVGPEFDSRAILRRFEAERQALALMEHEHIARVLDAGATPDGRPYFVMELVKGVPITRYCDENHLDLRQRLGLITEVCRAIQHAHHKGIIHRDIKPGNVLVAEYDGRPSVKVIDFGVAKAIHQPLTEKTFFTQFGQLVGTLEYMSPEQARLNQLDIDTRSDVYSLGVLLYELMTGSTPFERARLRDAAFDEMLRIIREEEPPRPSEKLSTTNQLPAVAANRSVEPARLNRLVRGELDWIVMKSLEKDRNRRYDSASALADDIENYLADRSVSASPPSWRYRMTKFVRQHRVGVAVAGLIVTLLVGGVAALWLERNKTLAAKIEADEQRDDALLQKSRAESNLVLARDALERAYLRIGEQWHPADSESIRVREAFLREALRFYEQLRSLNRDNETTEYEHATAHLRVAQLHAHLGELDVAFEAHRAALDHIRQMYIRNPDSWELTNLLIQAQVGVAQVELRRGQLDASRAARLAALETVEAFRQRHPDHGDAALSWSRIIRTRTYDQGFRGERAEAESTVRKVVAELRRVCATPAANEELRKELAGSLGQLAGQCQARNADGEAAELLQDEVELWSRLASGEQSVVHRVQLGLAQAKYGLLLDEIGQTDQAQNVLAAADQTLLQLTPAELAETEDFEQSVHLLNALARHFANQGDSPRATTLLQLAAQLADRATAENRNNVKSQVLRGESHQALALMLSSQGKVDTALAAHQAAIRVFEDLCASFPDQPEHYLLLAGTLEAQAASYRMQKKMDAAFDSMIRAELVLRSARERFPSRYELAARLGRIMSDRAYELMLLQRREESIALYRQALKPCQEGVQLGDPNHATLGAAIDCYLRFANLIETNEAEAAQTLDATDTLLAQARQKFPDNSKFLEQASSVELLRARLAARNKDSAEECARAALAVALLEQSLEKTKSDSPRMRQRLIQARLQQGWALLRGARTAEALQSVEAVLAIDGAPYEQQWSTLQLIAECHRQLQTKNASTAPSESPEGVVRLGEEILKRLNSSDLTPAQAVNLASWLANVDEPSWRDPARALVLVEIAMEKKPTSAVRLKLLITRITALLRKGDYAACLESIEQLEQEVGELTAQVWLMRAIALHHLQRTDEARKAYQSGIARLGSAPQAADQAWADEAQSLLQ